MANIFYLYLNLTESINKNYNLYFAIMKRKWLVKAQTSDMGKVVLFCNVRLMIVDPLKPGP